MHEVPTGPVLLTTQGTSIALPTCVTNTLSPTLGGSAPEFPTQPVPFDAGWRLPVRTVIATPPVFSAPVSDHATPRPVTPKRSREPAFSGFCLGG